MRRRLARVKWLECGIPKALQARCKKSFCSRKNLLHAKSLALAGPALCL